MTATPPLQPPPAVPEVIAYQELRFVMGILGIALPIVVPIGAAIAHFPLQSSLSSYYYTNMGNVFVGALCAIGVFLFSYKGYPDDKGAPGVLASIFAIGVAIFPTARDCGDACATGHQFSMHETCAALLFGMLTYFAGRLFRRTSAPTPTPRKLLRNKIYLACAIVMGLSILLIALWTFVFAAKLPQLAAAQPVFWLEAAAIEAFGISWLTKSEVILPG